MESLHLRAFVCIEFMNINKVINSTRSEIRVDILVIFTFFFLGLYVIVSYIYIENSVISRSLGLQDVTYLLVLIS
jgi:hypothetical protein